jgi:hypothetical protein
VTAVVESAGQRAPRLASPAGLTEREDRDAVCDGARADGMGRTPDYPASGSPVASSSARQLVERRQAKEDGMTTAAIEQQRRGIYEIAEAIAPTWERRGADVEEFAPKRGDRDAGR